MARLRPPPSRALTPPLSSPSLLPCGFGCSTPRRGAWLLGRGFGGSLPSPHPRPPPLSHRCCATWIYIPTIPAFLQGTDGFFAKELFSPICFLFSGRSCCVTVFLEAVLPCTVSASVLFNLPAHPNGLSPLTDALAGVSVPGTDAQDRIQHPWSELLSIYRYRY